MPVKLITDMDTTIQVRPATEADATVIKDLVQEGNINPTGLDWRRFFVAQTGSGEVIGCVQVKPHRHGVQELASLAVASEWRQRGVAHALLLHLLAEHRGHLYLMCRSGLGGMYRKYGFEALSEEHMPTYFRRVSKLGIIIVALRRQGETLLIMGRPGEQS